MWYDNIVCPKCKQTLIQKGCALKCENGHSYDIAKEGYVNLILPNQKKSKMPGDNKIMVEARREFLRSNSYQALSEEICAIIAYYEKSTGVILDAGCGTGYYIEKISDSAKRIGVDISRDAIKIASKCNEAINYIVASIFELPIRDNSIDCILNVFAPKPNCEFRRVLKQGGILIEVVPGPKHLLDIKKAIYELPREGHAEKEYFDLNLLERRMVSYNKVLEKGQLINLFKMTPLLYKSPPNAVENLIEHNSYTITFDFIIKVWEKNDF